MSVKTFFLNGFISCMFLTLCSCIEKNDLYQAGEEKGGKEYAEQFSNYTEITVNISSAHEGVVYAIYFSYPYEDGDLVKDAYLLEKTPVSTSLKVPKDVKTLYILGNGKMIESGVTDLSIDDSTPASRSVTINEDVLNAINSQYFPEKSNNVKGVNLYKCTDLRIDETESSGPFNEAEIWISYLGDGGFCRSGMYGKLWFYTYPSDKMDKLTIEDCTFYGRNGTKIVKVDYSSIRVKDGNTSNSGNPVFYSKEENDKVTAGTYSRYSLGAFPKGTNVGFVFRGPDERPQFTTPALNCACDEPLFDNSIRDYNYIGKTIEYKDGSGKFEIDQQVSNGFIYHIQVGAFEGNVLGMENRTVGYRAYDGDYNDMLCLIESNPIAISPSEPITPPEIDGYTRSRGYYLFEDNYPSQGDFDFNDVVIEYNIITYSNKTNKSKQVYAKLLASGCSFSNEFGFKDDNGYNAFFNGINGFMNVRGTSDETACEEVTKILVGEVKPYLNNGKGYIFDDEYNTDEYPYVLDIPYDDTTPFRWCQENVNISSAYPFEAPRSNDWYATPTDENFVIQR